MATKFSDLLTAVKEKNCDKDLKQIYKYKLPILYIREELSEWIEGKRHRWDELAEYVDQSDVMPTQSSDDAFTKDLFDEFIAKIDNLMENWNGQQLVAMNLRDERKKLVELSASTVVKNMSECLKKEQLLFDRLSQPDYDKTRERVIRKELDDAKHLLEILGTSYEKLKNCQTSYSFERRKLFCAMKSIERDINNTTDESILQGLRVKLKSVVDCVQDFTSQFHRALEEFVANSTKSHTLALSTLANIREILKSYLTSSTHHYIQVQKEAPSIDALQNVFPDFGKQVWALWNTLYDGKDLVSTYNLTTDKVAALDKASALDIQLERADLTEVEELCNSVLSTLYETLNDSFIVESQPNPLIRVAGKKIATQQSSINATVRVLALEHIVGDIPYEVKASFLSETVPDKVEPLGKEQLKKQKDGSKRAEFKGLKTKELEKPKVKRGHSEMLTYDHRYRIRFEMTVPVGRHSFGLEVSLKTYSLPILTTTNKCQESDGWGALMWQCYDSPNIHKEILPQKETMTWGKVAEMLNMKVKHETDRELDATQLKFLGTHLAGLLEKDASPPTKETEAVLLMLKSICESKSVTNTNVTPNLSQLKHKGLKFWEWFDACLKLLMKELLQPWNEGRLKQRSNLPGEGCSNTDTTLWRTSPAINIALALIHGFVSDLYIKKISQLRNPEVPDLTYIFRFSISTKSSINIDWIHRTSTKSTFSTRYVSEEIKDKINLGQIVRTTKSSRGEPMKYLFKDGKLCKTCDVFRHYSMKQEPKPKTEESHYITYVGHSVQNVLDEYADDDCQSDYTNSPRSVRTDQSAFSPTYSTDFSTDGQSPKRIHLESGSDYTRDRNYTGDSTSMDSDYTMTTQCSLSDDLHCGTDTDYMDQIDGSPFIIPDTDHGYGASIGLSAEEIFPEPGNSMGHQNVVVEHAQEVELSIDQLSGLIADADLAERFNAMGGVSFDSLDDDSGGVIDAEQSANNDIVRLEKSVIAAANAITTSSGTPSESMIGRNVFSAPTGVDSTDGACAVTMADGLPSETIARFLFGSQISVDSTDGLYPLKQDVDFNAPNFGGDGSGANVRLSDITYGNMNLRENEFNQFTQ